LKDDSQTYVRIIMGEPHLGAKGADERTLSSPRG
jgi:hypothetical protein